MRPRGLLCGLLLLLPSATEASRPAAVAGLFIDITAKAGIHFSHVASHSSHPYLLQTMGSGLALFDCDDDHCLDIFLVNGVLSGPGTKRIRATTSSSYLSASDRRVHFALGTDKEVQTIEVQWPSGIHQILRDIQGDHFLLVEEPGIGKTGTIRN